MSYSNIPGMQAKIRELKALITQLNNIISSSDSLSSSLQEITTYTKEVIVNKEEYDKGKLKESIKALSDIRSECSTVITKANNKISQLEHMIQEERRKEAELEKRRKEAQMQIN